MYASVIISLAFSLLPISSRAALDKPPLRPNLDYLEQGLLDNMHPTHSTWDIWGPGWIPEDCKAMTENAGLNPFDVETYNVKYDDCDTAWVLCRHTSSPDPLINMIDLFGRLPVRTRQYVRHMIALPRPEGGYAYNWNGNIAMFNRINGDLTVFLHESAHSLDLLGAYPDKPLSSSDNWLNNYNQDSHVPDPYAQTNQVENVAQNTVVDAYNLNVPGDFAGVEPEWQKIFHQYATIQTAQRDAGNLLVPGGTCTSRLTNGAPVPQGSGAKRWLGRRVAMAPKPDVALPDGLEVIPNKQFSTEGKCQLHW
ncbi:MAG: hypothetical protein Q9226_004916 [Calogaya cf. arnoldii]